MASRAGRATGRHFDMMVQYMEEHPDFARGKLDATYTVKDKMRHWAILSERLNSEECGPVKSTKKWRKAWFDYKSAVRGKYARILQHARETKGSEPPKEMLTPLEERIINIIGHKVATTQRNVKDFAWSETEETAEMDALCEDVAASPDDDVSGSNFRDDSAGQAEEDEAEILEQKPLLGMETTDQPASGVESTPSVGVSDHAFQPPPKVQQDQRSAAKTTISASLAELKQLLESNNVAMQKACCALQKIATAHEAVTEAVEQKAAAYERLAAATEKTAEAELIKAHAAIRKAAALEKIAAALAASD